MAACDASSQRDQGRHRSHDPVFEHSPAEPSFRLLPGRRTRDFAGERPHDQPDPSHQITLRSFPIRRSGLIAN